MKNREIGRKGGGIVEGAIETTLPGRESCSPSPVKSDNIHCTPTPIPPASKKDPLDLTIQSLTPSTFQSMSITEPREEERDNKGRNPKEIDPSKDDEGPSLTISTIRPPKDTTTTSSTSQCMCMQCAYTLLLLASFCSY